MQKHEDNLAARINGNALQPLAGASVTVTDDATGLPAALYSDDGVTPLAQPIITGNEGEYAFYAANGEYTVTFSGTRFATFTRKVILADPSDNPYLTQAAAAAPTGAAQVGHGSRTVADEIEEIPVASGPRDAILYHNATSVKIARRFVTMAGFRYRGQYTKAKGRMHPLPDNIATCAPSGLAAETAFKTDTWYAAFAVANVGDINAQIVTMPFLRVASVAGNVVSLNRGGEMVHSVIAQTHAWKSADNLASVDCLVISENGGYSGRLATITANDAGSITMSDVGLLTFGDYLLPAPPGFSEYCYLATWYMDSTAVRNIYDSGVLVKTKMNELQSPNIAAGALPYPGQIMQCAGYISPLATAVVIDSGGTLSTAVQGDYAEYFDVDGSNHIVQTEYMRKNATVAEPYFNSAVTIPFLYYQKFNYYTAGSVAADRASCKLDIKGWIEP